VLNLATGTYTLMCSKKRIREEREAQKERKKGQLRHSQFLY
jgi:hypothetical protein